MKIEILGTKYDLIFRKKEEDKELEKLDGYCCSYAKEIIILDPTEYVDSEVVKTERLKEVIRHEIVHAFLSESGLKWDAYEHKGAWSKNEEMIDWFAVQSPKIHKAFQDANAI